MSFESEPSNQEEVAASAVRELHDEEHPDLAENLAVEPASEAAQIAAGERGLSIHEDVAAVDEAMARQVQLPQRAADNVKSKLGHPSGVQFLNLESAGSYPSLLPNLHVGHKHLHRTAGKEALAKSSSVLYGRGGRSSSG